MRGILQASSRRHNKREQKDYLIYLLQRLIGGETRTGNSGAERKEAGGKERKEERKVEEEEERGKRMVKGSSKTKQKMKE